MIGSLFLTMSTYVIGFCFMEAGCHASGITFNGYDQHQQPRFDRIKSVSIIGLITSYRVSDFLKSWNSSVQQWLTHYVYLRMLDSKKRGQGNVIAALTVFMVSAVWHGFYPGFHSFFLGAFVLDYFNKLASPIVGPLFEGWCPTFV